MKQKKKHRKKSKLDIIIISSEKHFRSNYESIYSFSGIGDISRASQYKLFEFLIHLSESNVICTFLRFSLLQPLCPIKYIGPLINQFVIFKLSLRIETFSFQSHLFFFIFIFCVFCSEMWGKFFFLFFSKIF